jgi:hypothetical protein
VGSRFLTIAVIVALVASCSSNASQPGPSPSPTPPTQLSSPPASASGAPSAVQTGPLTTGPNVRPGEKPPTIPAAAGRHTSPGAIAFAIYYFEAFDWSIATNDVSLIGDISSTECASCARVLRFFAELRRSGDVLRGGRTVVTDAGIAAGRFNYRGEVVVRVHTTQSAEFRGQPDSRSARVADRTTSTSLVFLNWRAGSWRVAEVAGP